MQHEEAIERLFESIVGMTIADVRELSDDEDRVESICTAIRQRREFDNAVRDFITIVLTTPLFGADEDSLRLELLKIPQLTGGHQWFAASTCSDEEFAKSVRGYRDSPVPEVLTLLRATACAGSRTDDARSFMLHGRSHPTAYEYSDHRLLFWSIVEAIRKSSGSRESR